MMYPWLEIPHNEYESHMLEVGQAQILSALIKTYLSRCSPESFALIGCATGNGLEHVNPSVSKAFALDINPDYLAIVNERFKDKANIITIQADVQNDELPFENVDLIFMGLVLEYVNPEEALSRILNSLSRQGSLVIVIQKSSASAFVSNTVYKNMEKLKGVSSEVDEGFIDSYLRNRDINKVERTEIEVSEGKSFIVLEYSKN